MFTQTHSTRRPVPWGHINPGETVWMKWCGGPIVARAKVQGFRRLENCDARMLRETTQGFKLGFPFCLRRMAPLYTRSPPIAQKLRSSHSRSAPEAVT